MLGLDEHCGHFFPTFGKGRALFGHIFLFSLFKNSDFSNFFLVLFNYFFLLTFGSAYLFKKFVTLVSDAVERARKTKVADLNGAILVDKHVGRFEVPMQHLALVHVFNTVEQIPQDGLYMLCFEIHATP